MREEVADVGVAREEDLGSGQGFEPAAEAAGGGREDERLVHEGGVDLLREDQLRQPDLTPARAGGIEEGGVEVVGLFSRCGGLLSWGLPGGGLLLGHQTFLPVGLPDGPFTFTGLVDWRTRTSAPFAPGTPPFTRMRLRSASTRTTL